MHCPAETRTPTVSHHTCCIKASPIPRLQETQKAIFKKRVNTGIPVGYKWKGRKILHLPLDSG
jgi:hypothetical protein